MSLRRVKYGFSSSSRAVDSQVGASCWAGGVCRTLSWSVCSYHTKWCSTLNYYPGFNQDHSQLVSSIQTLFTGAYAQIIQTPNPTLPGGWYHDWSNTRQQLIRLKDNIALGSEHEQLNVYLTDMIKLWGKAGEVLSFEWRPLTECDNPGCDAWEPSLACERCCSAFYCSAFCQEQYVNMSHGVYGYLYFISTQALVLSLGRQRTQLELSYARNRLMRSSLDYVAISPSSVAVCYPPR